MPETPGSIKLKTRRLNLYYGNFHALGDVEMDIKECSITAIIGPSGCGKSSLLRVFNRMNDLIASARVVGEVLLDDINIYQKAFDVAILRKRVGMVFQKPNVFPMSIYDNIAVGPRHQGIKKRQDLDDIVESCLRQAALFEEVKDKLKTPGQSLTLGAQQQLCIARALAVEPEVILMDESCSALDPESTMRVEELMLNLAKQYTIVIVTHNMEQALRVSDMSAFMMIGEDRIGRLVEYAQTTEMFANPKDKRTEDYITGRFG
ncbi:MAG: phosphate ABC transporter ATP-binding protein PstB [Coriobacteriales bacterium]|jgi:phosphate transport system ATP-binding protein|nr:phosphate ABC transporter ATP-binding protein PstB [Coriobacteriales bacterium]